jgi:hypothetical protein
MVLDFGVLTLAFPSAQDLLGKEQPRELAHRIEQLPEAVLEQTHAKKTVKAITRMFTRSED